MSKGERLCAEDALELWACRLRASRTKNPTNYSAPMGDRSRHVDLEQEIATQAIELLMWRRGVRGKGHPLRQLLVSIHVDGKRPEDFKRSPFTVPEFLRQTLLTMRPRRDYEDFKLELNDVLDEVYDRRAETSAEPEMGNGYVP